MNVNSLALLFIDPEAWLAATTWCAISGMVLFTLLNVLKAIAETDATNVIVATISCAITGVAIWGAVTAPTICGIVIVAFSVAALIAAIAASAWLAAERGTARR